MDGHIEAAAILAMMKGLDQTEARHDLPPGEYDLTGFKIWIELNGKIVKQPDSTWTRPPISVHQRVAALVYLVEHLNLLLGDEEKVMDLVKGAFEMIGSLPHEEVERLESIAIEAESKAKLPPGRTSPRAGTVRGVGLEVDVEVVGGPGT